jgi:SAM-dependent methyltransferase
MATVVRGHDRGSPYGKRRRELEKMSRLSILRTLRQRRTAKPLDQAAYWEMRAPDLVHGYDHPETWAERGWLAAGIEEELVPRLLRDQGVASVLVVGAGTGRQYDFLGNLGAHVRGFDISQTLARAASERHPEIETLVDDVLGAEQRHAAADAVLATAVLQHIAPSRIRDAARSVASLARRLIILREATWLATSSTYQWAHDYNALFPGWELVQRVVTDDTERYRVELRALIRRPTRTT